MCDSCLYFAVALVTQHDYINQAVAKIVAKETNKLNEV